jgi:hypothetical protein
VKEKVKRERENREEGGGGEEVMRQISRCTLEAEF